MASTERIYQRYFETNDNQFIDNGNSLLVNPNHELQNPQSLTFRERLFMLGGASALALLTADPIARVTSSIHERFSDPNGLPAVAYSIITMMALGATVTLAGVDIGKRLSERKILTFIR